MHQSLQVHTIVVVHMTVQMHHLRTSPNRPRRSRPRLWECSVENSSAWPSERRVLLHLWSWQVVSLSASKTLHTPPHTSKTLLTSPTHEHHTHTRVQALNLPVLQTAASFFASVSLYTCFDPGRAAAERLLRAIRLHWRKGCGDDAG
mmetsp:Transcript_40861/g.65794  ORF Transcript_40861/g.65794 Transcript_40861/m.65794 type:complete len:147 (+) Transcript_40861:190-630(+)